MDHPEKIVLNLDGSEPSIKPMVETWRAEAKSRQDPTLDIMKLALIDFLADMCILHNNTCFDLGGETYTLTLPKD